MQYKSVIFHPSFRISLMLPHLDKFLHLVTQNATHNARNHQKKYYNHHYNYLERLKGELTELEEVIHTDQDQLLKFELADVAWTFFWLLEQLHIEGRIDKNTFFQDAYNKIAARIPDAANDITVDSNTQRAKRKTAKTQQKKSLWLTHKHSNKKT